MFKVMGLNTANYDDHNVLPPGLWTERLSMIVQAIIDSDADVIGLSEIRYTQDNPFNTTCQAFWADQNVPVSDCGSMDMGQQILTLLQARSTAYAAAAIMTSKAAIYSAVPPVQWEGLSIISRFPFVGGYITHSQGDGPNTRITQWASVQTPADGPLAFFNTHFSLNAQSRLSNAQEVLNLMSGALGSATTCLVGDMNAVPTDPAMGILQAGGLVDVWTQLNATLDGYSFQSWNPYERIDYCWASTGLAATASAMTLVGAQASPDGSHLSDHIGTLTTFG